MTLIADLLNTAFSRRKTSLDAIGALGLLLEEKRAKRPPGEDGGLLELLGPELATYRLSDAERTEIIEALSNAVLKQRKINHSMIWALNKSADERIFPVLATVLKRTLRVGSQEDAASEALNGLALFYPTSKSVLEEAARLGQGEVREQAQELLERLSLYDD
ncbi:hypothetical protein [Deinococcus multiflagellatus]|uniref:HEAT repeat domain-containing protein n=1 Tax=Deinococcus multiflagellatus TaxID=1656887 RepID=A0ABW1ZKP7_9DEIO|nr:hypothetical protein [Deinococcus multiflagellatus]MBZ9713324.1 hypothetical protein [Deinococcus multiflagellatus]